MHRIFTRLMAWISPLFAVPCAPDPLRSMSPAELADLPVSHPASDTCGC
jgi:hypothetical protein